MKIPKLYAKTPVTVTITDGLNEDGADNVVGTYVGVCRFDEKAKLITSVDGRQVTATGTVYIFDDIAPGRRMVQGGVSILGNSFQVLDSNRYRDEDGRVLYTSLTLQ